MGAKVQWRPAAAASVAAIRAGKHVALANKETLVVAGALVVREAAEAGISLLPVDSEHNALHQCLRGERAEEVQRLWLTASGGPFRRSQRAELARVTAAEALRHPTWNMGPKITIDSATLFNKGLEMIEAKWLFGIGMGRIEVVVHPQSVIHSLVQYVDGSVLAQLGNPDMRTPIAHALAWPDRHESGVGALDLLAVARLDFESPDPRRFPCLRLAFEAISAGGTAPAVLNAANEVAVEQFLAGKLAFTEIAEVVEQTVAEFPHFAAEDLDQLLAADGRARALAEQQALSRV